MLQKYIFPLTPPNFLHYFNVKGLDLTQVWHFNLLYSSSQIFPGEGWWRVVKSQAHSSPYQNNSYTTTYTTLVKGEEYFWNWRIIATSCSGLQIRKENVEHFLTADCKSAGTPHGRQPPHALQIRRDASRKKGRFKINIRPPADFHLHNRCWASAYQLLCKRTTAVVRLER